MGENHLSLVQRKYGGAPSDLIRFGKRAANGFRGWPFHGIQILGLDDISCRDRLSSSYISNLWFVLCAAQGHLSAKQQGATTRDHERTQQSGSQSAAIHSLTLAAFGRRT